MIGIRADAPADVHFGAYGLSFVIHSVAIALAIFIATRPSVQSKATAFLPDSLTRDIVWLPAFGPGGGGGGGGNRAVTPARKAESVGADQRTVPVAKAPSDDAPVDEPPSPQNLVMPAVTTAADELTRIGTLDGPAAASDSQGSGTNGGAGTGRGHGDGSGTGDGLGPGLNAGTGDGVYRPGNGVEVPRVLRQVRPQYTAQAMRAKVQGTVLLECIVMPDGTAGSIKVLRSLDPTFGLDQEAIKALRQWQFAPGTLKGQAVPVQVTIEITFTLR